MLADDDVCNAKWSVRDAPTIQSTMTSRGRIKQADTKRVRWKESKRYQAVRRQHASAERKLAAHRKSLHGKLVHDIVRVGKTMHIEKTSYKGWQKRYGKSMGLRAPGMFLAHLRRTVAKTGGTLSEVSAFQTKLSQYCHGCKRYVNKPLSQRWHQCACGVGPVQRDLYSAFLLAYLEPEDTIPSISLQDWEGAELRCEPRWSDYTNVRMRGSHCLEALASPEQERVGSKFLNTHDKSFSSLRGRRRSVGGVQRTPAIDGGESQKPSMKSAHCADSSQISSGIGPICPLEYPRASTYALHCTLYC